MSADRSKMVGNKKNNITVRNVVLQIEEQKLKREIWLCR